LRSVYRNACFAALAAALTWTSWPSLRELASRWMVDPAYSHGFFVPLFSLYLLWRRREMVGASSAAIGSGTFFLVVGALLELAAGLLMIRTLAHYSLPFFVAGVCLAMWGWRGMNWAWPSIAFLFFMVPLPGPIADAMSQPLQRIATLVATYVVQLVGVPAVAEGNVILLSDARLGVAEACSGLRMLVAFVTFAAGAVLLIDRKVWEKGLILISAVPIAIICNVVRITVTAAMYEWVSSEAADAVFHDLAGWLMMPLALLLLGAELRLLSALFVVLQVPAPLAMESTGVGKSLASYDAKKNGAVRPSKKTAHSTKTFRRR
jgi:exosortase